MKAALLAISLAALTACSKPEPPHLVPKEVRVAAVSPVGLDVVVKVEATNPNSVPLSAQSFTGKAKLDNKYELATVTVAKPFTLPPKQATLLEVPMTLPWSDLTALNALAMTTQPVPYVVEGGVTIGGDSLNVTIPYSVSGTIARDQLIGAAMKGIPGLPIVAPAPRP